MLYQLAFCVCLFAPILNQERALPEISVSNDTVFPDLYLVRAHALAAVPFEFARATATPFEIDHVYIGPGELKAKTVSVELYKDETRFSMSSTTSAMPVVKGEPAVFWTRKVGKGGYTGYLDKVVFAPTLKSGPWASPYPAKYASLAPATIGYTFERGDAKYEMAVARSEVFEKIYHAAEKDRFKLIDGYVRSGDSVKGAAALALLVPNMGKSPNDTVNPKIADYVLPFATDESVSPRLQVAVDWVLLHHKEGWQQSPECLRMYRHWFAGAWKDKKEVPWDASDEAAVARVFATLQPYPFPQAMELGMAGMVNPARSDRFKTELPRQLVPARLIGGPKGEREREFEKLLRTTGKRNAEREVAAAKLLAVFAPFSEQQRATIRALRRLKLRDEVAREIDRALAIRSPFETRP